MGVHRSDWRPNDLWARPVVGDFSHPPTPRPAFTFLRFRFNYNSTFDAARVTLLPRRQPGVDQQSRRPLLFLPPPPHDTTKPPRRPSYQPPSPRRKTVTPTTLYSSATGVSAAAVSDRLTARANTTPCAGLAPSPPSPRTFVHRIKIIEPIP